MDKHVIGIRLHDINQGLVVVSGGLVNRYYRATRLMGAVAQISGLLAGQQQVGYEKLLVAVGELGVDDSLLDKTLAEMQELGFLRVTKRISGDHTIDIKVPLVGDRYNDIGQRWEDLNPSSIEETSLKLTNDLASTPRYQDEIYTKYDIRGTQEGDIIRDILASASVLGSYISHANGQEILYSPLYWEDNPEKISALAGKYELEDVSKAIESIRGYQGLPEANMTDAILLSVSETGLLPVTTVNSSAGPKRFLFTPVQGVKRLEKSVLEKAFAIISSIRYGQHHAQITKLRYGAAELLEILKDRKQMGPHSEILGEYSPLVNLMVGRVSESPSGRYTFYLDDTDENMRALEIAMELASIGETMPRTKQLAAATKLLLPPGTFREPARTRLSLRQSVKASDTSIKRISDIISGVSPDVL